MATNKELADAYRLCASDSQESWMDDRADELDPPKPEYANGTVAWITARFSTPPDRKYLVQRRNDKWCESGQVLGWWEDDEVSKVEPLRVLADDEIAVKYIDYFDHSSDGERRYYIDTLGENSHPLAGKEVLRAYMSALKASGK